MNETTGQRIARRRRMLGLSQESLGQQLGVSRSAVAASLEEHNRHLTEAVSTGDPDYWIALAPNLTVRQGELAFLLPELHPGDELSLRVEARFRAGDRVTPFQEELQVWFYENGELK